MSSPRRQIDPAIVEILEEIAADPRAKFLRVDRLIEFDATSDLFEAVSSRSVDLTTAERHLVAVYREEVAWLLREAWKKSLYADPVTSAVYDKYVTVDEPVRTIDDETLRNRLELLRSSEVDRDFTAEAIGLLEECVVHGNPVGSRKSLALASQRLAPSDEARIHIAIEAVEVRQWSQAQRLLDLVLSGSPTDLIRSSALETIGFCNTEAGMPSAAMVAYRSAALSCDSRPDPTAHWLILACVAEHLEQALEAAAAIDAMIASHHPCIDMRLRALQLYRTAGRQGHSWDAQAFVRSLEDRFGPASKRIANGLI